VDEKLRYLHVGGRIPQPTESAGGDGPLRAITRVARPEKENGG